MKNWLKSRATITIFDATVKAYKMLEFRTKFDELEWRFLYMHKHLGQLGRIEKWARAMFKGNKYNIMTTNIVEALNSMLKKS